MAKYKGKMSDIEEIRKLEPEERIRRLKEVEEGRKKEIEEAETLIRDSMLELEDTAEKKYAPIRQVKAHDISQLLTAEEKRMFRTARFAGDSETSVRESERQPNLEEVAAEEMPGKTQQKGGPIYGTENVSGKTIYKNSVTTTGESRDEDRKLYSGPSQESGGEFYKSDPVTGKQAEEAYKTDGQSGSGTYERRKEEEEKKKRFDMPW